MVILRWWLENERGNFFPHWDLKHGPLELRASMLPMIYFDLWLGFFHKLKMCSFLYKMLSLLRKASFSLPSSGSWCNISTISQSANWVETLESESSQLIQIRVRKNTLSLAMIWTHDLHVPSWCATNWAIQALNKQVFFIFNTEECFREKRNPSGTGEPPTRPPSCTTPRQLTIYERRNANLGAFWPPFPSITLIWLFSNIFKHIVKKYSSSIMQSHSVCVVWGQIGILVTGK